MSNLLESISVSSAKPCVQRPDCDVCGTRMRIRLTGPEILAGNKQAVIYICECGHEQSCLEDLKAESSPG